MTSKRKTGGRKASMLLLQAREIGAAEFKAHCLEIMDEVERLGVEVIITKHRRAVARLIPIDRDRKFIGSLRGAVAREGDLISPIDEPWEADESNLA